MPVGMQLIVRPGQVLKHVRGMHKAMHNLGPVRRDFAGRMESSVEQNFRSSGRPIPWQPSIRALTSGGKTLIKTARLKNSITSRVRGEHVVIGSNVSYARAHQKGVDKTVTQRVRAHRRNPKNRRAHQVRAHTRRMRLRLVARPFLLVQQSDRAYLRKRIRQHLAKARRRGK